MTSTEIFFQQQFVLVKMYLWTRKMQFWKPCQNFCTISWKVFCSTSILLKKYILLRKVTQNFALDSKKADLTTLLEGFRQNQLGFWTKSENYERFFFEKLVFLRMLLWTRRRLVWKPWWNFLYMNFFFNIRKKQERNTSFNGTIFFKLLFWTRRKHS